MKPLTIIFLVLFGLTSIVELLFCFLELEKPRKITKPFCVLMLGFAALVQFPASPCIYVGAFLGAIGDIFMLWNKKGWGFSLGCLFFGLGHFAYLSQAVRLFSFTVPGYAYGILLAGIFVAMWILFIFTKKMVGWWGLLGNAYIPMLMIMLAASVALVVDMPVKWPAVLVLLGYVFFNLSDLLVSIVTFVKDIKRRDFPIMLTYLLGELLIVLGLMCALLTQLSV